MEKESFEKSWHSFVDVQVVRKIREGIKYITKYLTTTKKGTQAQVLTLALYWLFRKRSYAVSEDFKDLIQASMNFSHQRLIQTNVREEEVSLKVVWVFISIFSASKLGIDRDE